MISQVEKSEYTVGQFIQCEKKPDVLKTKRKLFDAQFSAYW